MDSNNTQQEMAIHFIAMTCHEANRAWCQSVGDYSQKPWDETEAWQKNSAVAGVRFRLENPDATKDAQHNAWMADKIKDGWVYGEVKDAEKKTHPCIVPFNELPLFQQKKDALFCAIVDSLKDKQNKTYLTFGDAIRLLKNGEKLTRPGWNGKGMFLYYVPANSYPAQTDVAKKEFGENGLVPYGAYFAFKSAQGTIEAGWKPSTMDMLAEDWQVIN